MDPRRRLRRNRRGPGRPPPGTRGRLVPSHRRRRHRSGIGAPRARGSRGDPWCSLRAGAHGGGLRRASAPGHRSRVLSGDDRVERHVDVRACTRGRAAAPRRGAGPCGVLRGRRRRARHGPRAVAGLLRRQGCRDVTGSFVGPRGRAVRRHGQRRGTRRDPPSDESCAEPDAGRTGCAARPRRDTRRRGRAGGAPAVGRRRLRHG